MIKISDKSLCCGCTACYAACPADAIVMKPDVLGFKYPHVDMSKCIDCGLCEKVCNFRALEKGTDVKAYAVRHKDNSVVRKSTSGAAFVAFSDYILEHGGVVYGAAFDGHFRVVHKRTASPEERDGLRKSKYVQSDMGDVFRQVRTDLKHGLTVLFTGTPCQTAGLRSYIGPNSSERLYLLDIVCHGVPSPRVWEEYVGWQEKRKGEEAVSVEFRDKQFGWRSSWESFTFSSEKVVSKSYNYLFYKNIMLRQSCQTCPYASVYRPSDITMADYWRKDKTCPEFASDDMGCSLILCHSEKGRQLLAEVSHMVNMTSADLDACLQLNLVQPSGSHPRRDDFERDFDLKGLEYVMRKYGDLGWRYRLKSMCKSIYQAVRQTARKLLGRR